MLGFFFLMKLSIWEMVSGSATCVLITAFLLVVHLCIMIFYIPFDHIYTRVILMKLKVVKNEISLLVSLLSLLIYMHPSTRAFVFQDLSAFVFMELYI